MQTLSSMLNTKIRLTTALVALAISLSVRAEINIGQSVPTTGPDAANGKAIALGASIYFSKLNAEGGINGQQIKLITLDDASDTSRVLSNTHDLIEKDEAVALLGYYNAMPMVKLLESKTLESAGIALVGVDSGAETIRTPGSPYLFHVRAGYDEEVARIVALLHDKLGMQRFAVLAQKGNFGEINVAYVKAELAKRKLQLLGDAWYDKSTGDTQAAAQALYKLQPDAVILVATSAPAASFIKQFKALGGNAQLYGLSQIQYSEVVRLAGMSAAAGLGIAQVFPAPGNFQNKLVREFQTDAKPYLTGMSVPEYALLEGYLSARVVADALRQAGKKPSRALVYKALAGKRKIDLGGYVLDFSEGREGSHFVEMTMISPTGALAR